VAVSPITNAAIAAIRLVIYVIETHLPFNEITHSPGVHHQLVGSALDVLTTPLLVSSPL
jgi:hypothetical protein